jgi:hypothetical protein
MKADVIADFIGVMILFLAFFIFVSFLLPKILQAILSSLGEISAEEVARQISNFFAVAASYSNVEIEYCPSRDSSVTYNSLFENKMVAISFFRGVMKFAQSVVIQPLPIQLTATFRDQDVNCFLISHKVDKYEIRAFKK